MIKKIEVGEKTVEITDSFAWQLKYKNQFKIDPSSLIIPILKASVTETDEQEMGMKIYEKIGFVNTANIFWAMAKVCHPSEIGSPDDWFDEFDEFPILDIGAEILTFAIESLQTTKKAKVSKTAQTPTQTSN